MAKTSSRLSPTGDTTAAKLLPSADSSSSGSPVASAPLSLRSVPPAGSRHVLSRKMEHAEGTHGQWKGANEQIRNAAWQIGDAVHVIAGFVEKRANDAATLCQGRCGRVAKVKRVDVLIRFRRPTEEIWIGKPNFQHLARTRLKVGDVVCADESFCEENNGCNVEVARGHCGSVIMVDDAGNAIVEFRNPLLQTWVRESNFDKLDLLLIEPGTCIRVVESFSLLSTRPVRLRKGSRGKVITLGSNGEAFISFRTPMLQEWVPKNKFVHLRRVALRTGDDVMVDEYLAGVNVRGLSEQTWGNGAGLRAGLRGKALRTDDNGNALVDFTELAAQLWIRAADFDKLHNVVWRPGDSVVMTVDSRAESQLFRGRRGDILSINEHGDALVKFNEIGAAELVRRESIEKLEEDEAAHDWSEWQAEVDSRGRIHVTSVEFPGAPVGKYFTFNSMDVPGLGTAGEKTVTVTNWRSGHSAPARLWATRPFGEEASAYGRFDPESSAAAGQFEVDDFLFFNLRQHTAGTEVTSLGIQFEVLQKRVLVSAVTPHSWADHEGIKVGDEILEVDGLSVEPLTKGELVAIVGPWNRPLRLLFADANHDQTPRVSRFPLDLDNEIGTIDVHFTAEGPLGLALHGAPAARPIVAAVGVGVRLPSSNVGVGSRLVAVNSVDVRRMTRQDLVIALQHRPLVLQFTPALAPSELDENKTDCRFGHAALWPAGAFLEDAAATIEFEVELADGDKWGAALAGGPPQAVRVEQVVPGEGASVQGVEAGDELLTINGRDVKTLSPSALERALREVRPMAIAMSRPRSPDNPYAGADIGLYAYTFGQKEQVFGVVLNPIRAENVTVKSIVAAGAGAALGMRAGDALLTVNGEHAALLARPVLQNTLRTRPLAVRFLHGPGLPSAILAAAVERLAWRDEAGNLVQADNDLEERPLNPKMGDAQTLDRLAASAPVGEPLLNGFQVLFPEMSSRNAVELAAFLRGQGARDRRDILNLLRGLSDGGIIQSAARTTPVLPLETLAALERIVRRTQGSAGRSGVSLRGDPSGRTLGSPPDPLEIPEGKYTPKDLREEIARRHPDAPQSTSEFGAAQTKASCRPGNYQGFGRTTANPSQSQILKTVLDPAAAEFNVLHGTVAGAQRDLGMAMRSQKTPASVSDDAAGIYHITHDMTPVAATRRLADVSSFLEAGRVVNVVEVAELHGPHAVRGRLSDPAGWIPLLDVESGQRWAVKEASPLRYWDGTWLHAAKEIIVDGVLRRQAGNTVIKLTPYSIDRFSFVLDGQVHFGQREQNRIVFEDGAVWVLENEDVGNKAGQEVVEMPDDVGAVPGALDDKITSATAFLRTMGSRNAAEVLQVLAARQVQGSGLPHYRRNVENMLGNILRYSDVDARLGNIDRIPHARPRGLHIDGAWGRQGQPGEVIATIGEGRLRFGEGQETRIDVDGPDRFSVFFLGQRYHAIQVGRELVWNDGRVWARAAGELHRFAKSPPERSRTASAAQGHLLPLDAAGGELSLQDRPKKQPSPRTPAISPRGCAAAQDQSVVFPCPGGGKQRDVEPGRFKEGTTKVTASAVASDEGASSGVGRQERQMSEEAAPRRFKEGVKQFARLVTTPAVASDEGACSGAGGQERQRSGESTPGRFKEGPQKILRLLAAPATASDEGASSGADWHQRQTSEEAEARYSKEETQKFARPVANPALASDEGTSLSADWQERQMSEEADPKNVKEGSQKLARLVAKPAIASDEGARLGAGWQERQMSEETESRRSNDGTQQFAQMVTQPATASDEGASLGTGGEERQMSEKIEFRRHSQEIGLLPQVRMEELHQVSKVQRNQEMSAEEHVGEDDQGAEEPRLVATPPAAAIDEGTSLAASAGEPQRFDEVKRRRFEEGATKLAQLLTPPLARDDCESLGPSAGKRQTLAEVESRRSNERGAKLAEPGGTAPLASAPVVDEGASLSASGGDMQTIEETALEILGEALKKKQRLAAGAHQIAQGLLALHADLQPLLDENKRTMIPGSGRLAPSPVAQAGSGPEVPVPADASETFDGGPPESRLSKASTTNELPPELAEPLTAGDLSTGAQPVLAEENAEDKHVTLGSGGGGELIINQEGNQEEEKEEVDAQLETTGDAQPQVQLENQEEDKEVDEDDAQLYLLLEARMEELRYMKRNEIKHTDRTQLELEEPPAGSQTTRSSTSSVLAPTREEGKPDGKNDEQEEAAQQEHLPNSGTSGTGEQEMAEEETEENDDEDAAQLELLLEARMEELKLGFRMVATEVEHLALGAQWVDSSPIGGQETPRIVEREIKEEDDNGDDEDAAQLDLLLEARLNEVMSVRHANVGLGGERGSNKDADEEAKHTRENLKNSDSDLQGLKEPLGGAENENEELAQPESPQERNQEDDAEFDLQEARTAWMKTRMAEGWMAKSQSMRLAEGSAKVGQAPSDLRRARRAITGPPAILVVATEARMAEARLSEGAGHGEQEQEGDEDVTQLHLLLGARMEELQQVFKMQSSQVLNALQDGSHNTPLPASSGVAATLEAVPKPGGSQRTQSVLGIAALEKIDEEMEEQDMDERSELGEEGADEAAKINLLLGARMEELQQVSNVQRKQEMSEEESHMDEQEQGAAELEFVLETRVEEAKTAGAKNKMPKLQAFEELLGGRQETPTSASSRFAAAPRSSVLDPEEIKEKKEEQDTDETNKSEEEGTDEAAKVGFLLQARTEELQQVHKVQRNPEMSEEEHHVDEDDLGAAELDFLLEARVEEAKTVGAKTKTRNLEGLGELLGGRQETPRNATTAEFQGGSQAEPTPGSSGLVISRDGFAAFTDPPVREQATAGEPQEFGHVNIDRALASALERNASVSSDTTGSELWSDEKPNDVDLQDVIAQCQGGGQATSACAMGPAGADAQDEVTWVWSSEVENSKTIAQCQGGGQATSASAFAIGAMGPAGADAQDEVTWVWTSETENSKTMPTDTLADKDPRME